MRADLHHRRRKENAVRLICSLGLDWRLLIPELFEVLRELVPFPQGCFVLYNDRLQGLEGYEEWPTPGGGEARKTPAFRYFKNDRMGELFMTGGGLRKLPAIYRGEQTWRIHRRMLRAHEFCPRIVQPPQVHHDVNLRLVVRDDLVGLLTLNRPAGDPDFTLAELSTLQRLLPFLIHALDQTADGVSTNGDWADAEQGLILFEAGGRIRYLDGPAAKIVDYALERRRMMREGWHVIHRKARLNVILKDLSTRLDAIGKPDAQPASIVLTNPWGRFVFRASWLDAYPEGRSGLYAARLQRQAPRSLRLALGLGRQTLSLRECQVALGLALGETHGKIAKNLGISERTVITHAQQVYDRLAVNSRVELMTMLLRQG